MTEDNKKADREPGTRADGEAMPPAAIDPAPDGKGIPPLPEPDVEGVGNEGGPSENTGAADKHLGPDQDKMVKDATGF